MILKASSYIESYRLRAKYAAEVHELAGRGPNKSLTEFTNSRIIAEMKLSENDLLVDVGCGDGCLLRKAKMVSHKIGISATEEESARLCASGLDVKCGLADRLPLPDSWATALVCNGVLLLVPPQTVPWCLREFYRVTRPGAKLWLGEIPVEPEWSEPPLGTMAEKSWYVLKHRGVRGVLRMLGNIATASVRRNPFLLYTFPLEQFHAPPEEVVRMAEEAGLALQKYWPHRVLDSHGREQDSNRYDYLFQR